MGEGFIPLATTLALTVIAVIMYNYVLKILKHKPRKNLKKSLLHVLWKRKAEIIMWDSDVKA